MLTFRLIINVNRIFTFELELENFLSSTLEATFGS